MADDPVQAARDALDNVIFTMDAAAIDRAIDALIAAVRAETLHEVRRPLQILVEALTPNTLCGYALYGEPALCTCGNCKTR